MSDDEPPDNRRGLLVALVFLVLLGLLGLWVSGALRQSGAVQDCTMQGRSNCATTP